MLRIGICEDEPADLARLREVMEGVLAELEMAAITESFNSGERLLAAIQGGVWYDLLLLDIYMEGWMASPRHGRRGYCCHGCSWRFSRRRASLLWRRLTWTRCIIC